MRGRFAALAAFYVIVGVVTFGHEASNSLGCDAAQASSCGHSGIKALSGVMAGIVWPLYWAWEAFE